MVRFEMHNPFEGKDLIKRIRESYERLKKDDKNKFFEICLDVEKPIHYDLTKGEMRREYSREESKLIFYSSYYQREPKGIWGTYLMASIGEDKNYWSLDIRCFTNHSKEATYEDTPLFVRQFGPLLDLFAYVLRDATNTKIAEAPKESPPQNTDGKSELDGAKVIY